MLSDIEIAQKNQIVPIKEIAAKLNMDEDKIEQYGPYKAKITMNELRVLQEKAKDKDKNLTFCNFDTKNSLTYQNFCFLLKLLTRNKPYSLSINKEFPLKDTSVQSYFRKDTNCVQVMAQQLELLDMNDNIKNSNLTTKIKTNNQTLKEKLKFNYLSLSNQLDI